MRALLAIRTGIDSDVLKDALEREAWLPALPQDHALVDQKKREVLAEVACCRRDEADETHRLTIAHRFNHTSGVISQSVANTYTIRMINASAEELKCASEDLVATLSGIQRRQQVLKTSRVEFSDVLIKDGNDHVIVHGRPNAYPIRSALKKSRKENYVWFTSLALTLTASYLGSPFGSWLFGYAEPDWHQFIIESFGRITTTALCTFIIFTLQILSNIKSEGKKGSIIWTRVLDEEASPRGRGNGELSDRGRASDKPPMKASNDNDEAKSHAT